MSVTYGFYNSKDGDRKYDAIQMSSIFDGIIRDGVFQHVGTAMMVVAAQGMMVNVGIGRAWFNHTWTLNDALLPIIVPTAEVILNRIDAVVIEVDSRETTRTNSIKIVKGTPSSNPVNPSMIKTIDRFQYPLAYIRVNANALEIRQADITNRVGTSETPFVTAPLEKMSIDALVAQWESQWKTWFSNLKLSAEEKTQVFLNWVSQFKLDTEQDINSWLYSFKTDNSQIFVNWYNQFKNSSENDFDVWFSNLKNQLDANQASNLQNQIDTHKDKKITGINGVHGIRFSDGKLQVHIGSGWAILAAVVFGLSWEYIQTLGLNWIQFQAKNYTWEEISKLVEVENG